MYYTVNISVLCSVAWTAFTATVNYAEEFSPCLTICLEAAQNAASNCVASDFLNSPHDHAHVAAFDYYGDAEGVYRIHDGVGNFSR